MGSDELEAQIQAQVEEWSSNSNECFTVDLRRGDSSTAASFRPEFTYPIFGEEEAIFGYRDLSITLSFAAHNLRPHLQISYQQKFPAQGEVRPTDIHAALRDFLPDTAFSNASRDDALRDPQAAGFRPPGERVREYTRGGQRYEIWCASLSDPVARQLLENMQVLVPMFIEGGTMLQLEQDWTALRWKLFLLYAVTPEEGAAPTGSPYSLVGYGTSYRIFTLPNRQKMLDKDPEALAASGAPSLELLVSSPNSNAPDPAASDDFTGKVASPLTLPSRERLSQFLILPPFQGGGHGQELYSTMYALLSQPGYVREFTVEDPNEAFDDLRDLCDLLHLRAHFPLFAGLRIQTTIPVDKLQSTAAIPTDLIVPLTTRETLIAKTKIMQRQFDRLVEMHTLSFIPALHRSRARITRREKASNEHDRAYYLWRLYVKQRLFVFNRDQLAQLEREERIEKLEAALDSVQEAYVKMLERVEAREKGMGVNGRVEEGAEVEAEAGAASSDVGRKARLGKRRVVDEEDEEDEADGVEIDMEQVNGHKKARVGL